MSKIDFEPLGDRVLVRPIEEVTDVTKSGIIIASQDDVNKELPQIGEVIAVGTGGTTPDCPNPSKFLEVGQIVYFNKYAGIDYELREDGDITKKPVKVKMIRLDAIDGKQSIKKLPTKK